jgi:hypothetical protein
MFRKKSIIVTAELLNDLLTEVKQTFSVSNAPAYIKTISRNITPNFLIINRPTIKFVGQAWLCSPKVKKERSRSWCWAYPKRLKLNIATHPTVTVDHEVYFAIILINGGVYKKMTRRGIRYIIGHEFAHLIQIVMDKEVNGMTSFASEEDHNDKWYRLARWCGSTGSRYISSKEIWV